MGGAPRPTRRLAVHLHHLMPRVIAASYPQRRTLLAVVAATAAVAGTGHSTLVNSGGALRVIPVAADGNCLFNAVAQAEAAADGKQPLQAATERARAEILRLAVVKELLARRAEIEWAIEGDFDQYVERMRRSGVWGGEPELLMLSYQLATPIEVYMYNPTLRRIQTYSESMKGSPLRVLFHGSGHYEALVA